MQLPDPNQPHLLFTDASMFCDLGILTQASPDESNKALLKLLMDKDPLKSVQFQMEDFQLKPSVVHPVAYISGNFTEISADGVQLKKNVLVFLFNQKVFLSFTKLGFY